MMGGEVPEYTQAASKDGSRLQGINERPVAQEQGRGQGPQNLNMWLDVNGEKRQRGNTKTMIFVRTPGLVLLPVFRDGARRHHHHGHAARSRSGHEARAGISQSRGLTLGIDKLGEQRQKVVGPK